MAPFQFSGFFNAKLNTHSLRFEAKVNIEERTQSLCLCGSPTVQDIGPTIDKWGPIKLKIFCIAKQTNKPHPNNFSFFCDFFSFSWCSFFCSRVPSRVCFYVYVFLGYFWMWRFLRFFVGLTVFGRGRFQKWNLPFSSCYIKGCTSVWFLITDTSHDPGDTVFCWVSYC